MFRSERGKLGKLGLAALFDRCWSAWVWRCTIVANFCSNLTFLTTKIARNV